MQKKYIVVPASCLIVHKILVIGIKNVSDYLD